MYDGRIIRRVNEFGGVEPHVEFIWLAYDVCVRRGVAFCACTQLQLTDYLHQRHTKITLQKIHYYTNHGAIINKSVEPIIFVE